MSKLIQYERRVIETWRTGRLGVLYMNSFSFSRNDETELGQLETITDILSSRPLRERQQFFGQIYHTRQQAAVQNDSEQGETLNAMVLHYALNILLR